jgi:hypothetical protein
MLKKLHTVDELTTGIMRTIWESNQFTGRNINTLKEGLGWVIIAHHLWLHQGVTEDLENWELENELHTPPPDEAPAASTSASTLIPSAGSTTPSSGQDHMMEDPPPGGELPTTGQPVIVL